MFDKRSIALPIDAIPQTVRINAVSALECASLAWRKDNPVLSNRLNTIKQSIKDDRITKKIGRLMISDVPVRDGRIRINDVLRAIADNAEVPAEIAQECRDVIADKF